MECIEAQSIVSEVLDGNPVDAAVLEAAKAHCRQCPQCAAYVRALNAVRRAPLPTPPDDLADRIMATIRAEAAAAEQAERVRAEQAAAATTLRAAETTPHDEAPAEGGSRAGREMTATERALEAAAAAIAAREGRSGTKQDAAGTAAAADQTPSPSGAPPSSKRFSVELFPTDRREIFALVGAAAAVVLVLTVGLALGIMRSVNNGSRAATTAGSTNIAAPSVSEPNAAAEKSATTGGAQDLSAGASMEGTPTAAATNLYAVLGGAVYVHSGQSDRTMAQLQRSGQIPFTFDASQAPITRTVYTDTTKRFIYIEDDAKVLQRFNAVIRQYKSTTYQLQSADITSFGGWPALPSQIPAPSAADGAPVFQLDGQDAAGINVYHRLGSDARTGIAIGPGTPPDDPAAGDPNWTWWVPIP